MPSKLQGQKIINVTQNQAYNGCTQEMHHFLSPKLLLSYVVKCLTIAFSGIRVNRILQGVTL
jgi:hypothetical protein